MSVAPLLVSAPKPFTGHVSLIQNNAISSWRSLLPLSEIVLIGDEPGIKDAASRYGARHVPEVKRNSLGTPLVSDIFERAVSLAGGSDVIYVNADIIIPPALLAALPGIDFDSFLLVASRLNVEVSSCLDFSAASWKDSIAPALKNGVLGGRTAIDIFVWRGNVFGEIPPFALGRTIWDNWLLWRARSRSAPLVLFADEPLIHQNHDYAHAVSVANVWNGEEAKGNFKLSGGWNHMCYLDDVDFILKGGRLSRNLSPSFHARRFMRRFRELKNALRGSEAGLP